MKLFFALLITLVFLLFSVIAATAERWSTDKALAWQDKVGYRAGANFVPSTAVNELEMFQEATYDPQTIDRELGYAASLGFNVVRVFLHNLLWEQGPSALLARLDHFLSITAKHDISVMFVLLDSCWNAYPKSGTQPEPIPGVHNSQWVQAPGIDILQDDTKFAALKEYVIGILSYYKDDTRIFAWDLWNEPNNSGYSEKMIGPYLQEVFSWARQVETTQPLTTPVWNSVKYFTFTPFQQLQMSLSDVISFHNYDDSQSFQKMIAAIQKAESPRPIVCTEYMARTHNSTFDPHIQILAENNVHAINWGLVSGRTQTIYPWETIANPATEPPAIWFHDILNADGTAFNQSEVTFIQKVMASKQMNRVKV